MRVMGKGMLRAGLGLPVILLLPLLLLTPLRRGGCYRRFGNSATTQPLLKFHLDVPT